MPNIIRGEEDEHTATRWLLRTVAVLVVIVIAVLILNPIEIIQPNEVGVIYNAIGGLDISTEWNSGWHFKIPILQSIIHIPISRQTVSMYGNNYDTDCKPYPDCDDMAIQVPTKEGLPVAVHLTVFFKVNATDAPIIVQQLTTNYRLGTVEPLMRSVVREIAGTMAITDLYGSGRAKLESAMFSRLSPELSKDHLILENVLIRDIILPPQITQAIQDKMTAEQTSLQKDYEISTANKNANMTIIVAQAKATSDALQVTIAAQAQANSTIAIAQANANKTIVEGLAQAQAIEAINRQLTQSPNYIQLVYAQTWDGKLPVFTGGGALPLINIPLNATR